ncbi:unnamed protein product [Rhizophagus irregularis]|nr:unnamed protein product [Rhizophagus irregularis]
MESLKRKEVVSGTSDMQWTVAILRRSQFITNIKPKTNHSNTSMTSKICTSKCSERKWENENNVDVGVEREGRLKKR